MNPADTLAAYRADVPAGAGAAKLPVTALVSITYCYIVAVLPYARNEFQGIPAVAWTGMGLLLMLIAVFATGGARLRGEPYGKAAMLVFLATYPLFCYVSFLAIGRPLPQFH